MTYQPPEPDFTMDSGAFPCYHPATLRAEVAKAEQRGRDEMREAWAEIVGSNAKACVPESLLHLALVSNAAAMRLWK